MLLEVAFFFLHCEVDGPRADTEKGSEDTDPGRVWLITFYLTLRRLESYLALSGTTLSCSPMLREEETEECKGHSGLDIAVVFKSLLEQELQAIGLLAFIKRVGRSPEVPPFPTGLTEGNVCQGSRSHHLQWCGG